MNYPIRIMVSDMPRPAREALVQRFTDSSLAYHNIDHILYMLKLHEQFFVDTLTARENRLIRFAIWWHDEWYDVSGTDNERRSADRAKAMLNLSMRDTIELDRLIMATKGHEASTKLSRILVDLDLAILGADRQTYIQYARAIRREYSIYEDAAYRAGRVAVLFHLSKVPLLKTLSLVMSGSEDALGVRARKNLLWERDLLLSDAATVEDALSE